MVTNASPSEVRQPVLLVRNATVRKYFDGISDMTLWRWIRYRGFPKPTKMNGRNYWNPSQIEQWQRDNAV